MRTASTLLGLLSLLLAHAHSALAAPPVVELGESDLKAEVRKPVLEYLDSSQPGREVLDEVARRKFEAYETSLLRFAPPNRTPPRSRQKHHQGDFR